MKSCIINKKIAHRLFLVLLAVFSLWLVCLAAEKRTVKGTYLEQDDYKRQKFHVLVLGQDEASGLADVMILVTVDRAEGSIYAAQIPRDTYFRYTEKDYKKINGAAETLGGEEALCRVLGQALAIPIDYYVTVDLEGVSRAVDVLGGIDVDVPCNMDYEDPAQSLFIHLKKGKQHLDGKQALGLIRFRSGYLRADIDRLDTQKLFLAAFYRAAENLERQDVPTLARMALESVKTNLSLEGIMVLLRSALDTEEKNIVLFTLPGEEVQSSVSGAWYYVLSRFGMAEVMERCFGIEGASACFDPAHLFSNPSRNEFEVVYRSHIQPQYYDIRELVSQEIAVE